MSPFRPGSRKLVTCLAVAAVLAQPCVTAVGADTPDKLDPAAAEKGKIAYGRYCTPCHGQAGRGDGSLAGDLRVSVPDLTTLTQRSQGKFPFERVVNVIDGRTRVRSHGTRDMPAWGEVFQKTEGTAASSPEAAVTNLAHYLWSLQTSAR
jgi:cbb3-type cytochrome c oxidase subunit III